MGLKQGYLFESEFRLQPKRSRKEVGTELQLVETEQIFNL